MTSAQKVRIRVFGFILGAAALLVPFTASSGSIEVNDACAGANCCAEMGSTCSVDGSVAIHHIKCEGGVDG